MRTNDPPSLRSALARALCLALLMLAACTAPPPPAEPPRVVRTLTVGAVPAARAHEFSGEVRARHESRLAFRVGGKIIERLVDVGASVKAGQPLARLDASDLALAVRAADARVDAAQTALDQARANLDRFTRLRDKNFISEAELERYRSALAAAVATLESALSEARFNRNQLDYTTLKAGNDGVITAIDAEVGQVVAAGMPVMMFSQAGEREIAIFVPEDKFDLVRSAPAFTVSLWATPGQWPGRLRELSPSADPLTRTYPARISVTGAPLQLGMSASVKLPRDQAARLIRLPLTALIEDAGGSAVWRLDPRTQTVHRNPVRTGERIGNEVRIEEGLREGQIIVSAGAHLLHEGQAVRALAP